MADGERWVDPEHEDHSKPYSRIHNYGELEDMKEGTIVGVDNPTVELSSKAIVDTAIVISEAYGDPDLKAADVLMFLVGQTKKQDFALEKYVSPELKELMESEAFVKYHAYLRSVLIGKRSDQVISVRLVGGTGKLHE